MRLLRSPILAACVASALTALVVGGIAEATTTAAQCNGWPHAGIDWSVPGSTPGHGCNLVHANLSGQYLGQANMTNANLDGANLAGATLAGANLSGATLTGVSSGRVIGAPFALPPGWRVIAGYLIGPGANLTHAVLTSANLAATDLSGADLAFANLNQANLTNVNLVSANLSDANLGGAIVTGAKLSGATLSLAEVRGLVGSPSTLPSGWRLIAGCLFGPSANLSGAALTGEPLSNVNLTGANLNGTVFTSANLTDANLSNAALVTAVLNAANLTNTNLTGAQIVLANLSNANLSGANLTNANLTDTKLTDATNMGTATVSGVVWSNTTCPDGTNSNSDGDTCVGHL